MSKPQITRGHWVLFGLAILALGSLGRQYIVTARSNAPTTSGGMGGRNPQQMAARRMERMTQQLHLSPQQQTQIQSVEDSSRPQMQQVRANTALSPEQKREQMRALRTDTQNRIKQLLTPEQQTQFDAMQTGMRRGFGGANGGNNGGNVPTTTG